MITVNEIADLRSRIESWRRGGNVAFVPTMGNLHAGHLSLVQAARRSGRSGRGQYLRQSRCSSVKAKTSTTTRGPWRSDSAMLSAEGTDLLFAPPVTVMYPKPQAEQTRVEVPGVSRSCCAAPVGPGHFVGVATVVCKLFNMVQPDIALFGKKDFQQLMVIRRMVEDLALPVKVIGVDTMREPDGLAMSSRNGYLSAPGTRAGAGLVPGAQRGTRKAAGRRR